MCSVCGCTVYTFNRCFFTIPLKIPVVKAYKSASAELRLTDCYVLDQAEMVPLLHCVSPPLVLLHVWCCPAQSLSVYTFTNGGNVLISMKHFAFRPSFRYMYNSFPTAVLYTARFSFSSSTNDSVVLVLFTLVDTSLESSRPSTAITSRMHFGFASTEHPRAVLSVTQPRKKILSPSFLHSSHNPHHGLV